MTTTAASAGRAVTPVLLTFNEQPNIERVLRALAWAADVIVLDSGSSDETERIARGFSNVRWFVRPFDTHGSQWEYALRSTGVASDYVMALDADHEVPPAFVDELGTKFIAGGYVGGVAGFEYRVQGRALMGSVYPPRLVVGRTGAIVVRQPGHTQELSVDGPVYTFQTRLIHDDRKALERFVASQLAYSRLESSRLANGGSMRWQDRVRRLGLMPLVAGLAAYVRSGGPLAGRASLRYAYERATFECLLAMRVLDRDNPHQNS